MDETDVWRKTPGAARKFPSISDQASTGESARSVCVPSDDDPHSSLPTDIGFGFLLTACNVFPHHVNSELMDPNPTQPKRRDNVLSSLNVTIEALSLAKEVSSITPAKAVFGSVSIILTMIRVGSSLVSPLDCRPMENHRIR